MAVNPRTLVLRRDAGQVMGGFEAEFLEDVQGGRP
jgi:hypothetical protein